MKTIEEKLKLCEDTAFELDEILPTRIWVEGDGEMYAEFQGSTRIHLTPFEAIKQIHAASVKVRKMLSS